MRLHVIGGLAAALLFVNIAGAVAPLEPVSTIALPGVKGRIDHLAADPSHHRLFVAALGNDSVEVVDTAGDAHASVHGLDAPQGVLYLADTNRLVIANGGGHRVDILNASSLAVESTIGGLDDADNVRYDKAAHVVIVGYGKGALRILDAASGRSVGDIALPGHPESFALEVDGPRAFVNVPSAHAVVVVDRTTRKAVARWETPWATRNYPMALDEAGRTLFVGARSPPQLLVYDTAMGNLVAKVPIGADTDDVFFDARRKRVYVICGEGRVDVIGVRDRGRYVREATIDTAPRARTGLFVPDEDTLYVAAPAAGDSPARILVYRVH
jgi:DNA-binding beta-propeller fold protein YncE